MRSLQTNILFQPTEVQGRREASEVAPAVAIIFVGQLDVNKVNLSEILGGESSTLDPATAARKFLDATLRDITITSASALDSHEIINKYVLDFIEQQEIAVQRNPILGAKFAELVKGASSPVRIAAGITIGAVGLTGIVPAIPISAIAITIGGATGGIVLIGSAVIFVEWLRRKVLG